MDTVGLRQQVRCKNDLAGSADAALKDSARLRLRAEGVVRATFAQLGCETHPARVFEAGGLRLRFPNAPTLCEAVLVNTGGGMAGGDRATIDLRLETGADVLATTQSAEKIYRTEGEASRVETRL